MRFQQHANPVCAGSHAMEQKRIRKADVRDLGLLSYEEAFDLQQQIVKSMIEEDRSRNTILLLEHPPVFTLGKQGGRENLTVPESFLNSRGIHIVQTQRGGNITFHGPGQLVVYPIIDLFQAGMAVKDFVYCLEEVMIRTCRAFMVTAERDDRNHGIWVGGKKIGSIGLTIRKGISFHGIALNVSNDLTPFSWINPCGLEGVSMTSLAAETERGSTILDMTSVKNTFLREFAVVLEFVLAAADPSKGLAHTLESSLAGYHDTH